MHHGEGGDSLREHLESLHDPHVFQVHGPLVTMDDRAQTLAYDSPAAKGSIEVWSGHWSPKSFHVTAELIVADPPLADAPLMNARAVRQRVVLVERGAVSLVDKVLRAQAAGAIGVVVTDTGECAAFDQLCSPGAEKKNGDGFAKYDLREPWSKVRIPVALLLYEDAETLLGLFD